MSKGIRIVRERFRKAVLKSIKEGKGDLPSLVEIADHFFGADLGYQVLISTFLRNETNKALAFLRKSDKVESVGKEWKPQNSLLMVEAKGIDRRQCASVRGNLKAQINFDHHFGLQDEARAKQRALDILDELVVSGSEVVEAEKEEVLEPSKVKA